MSEAKKKERVFQIKWAFKVRLGGDAHYIHPGRDGLFRTTNKRLADKVLNCSGTREVTGTVDAYMAPPPVKRQSAVAGVEFIDYARPAREAEARRRMREDLGLPPEEDDLGAAPTTDEATSALQAPETGIQGESKGHDDQATATEGALPDVTPVDSVGTEDEAEPEVTTLPSGSPGIDYCSQCLQPSATGLYDVRGVCTGCLAGVDDGPNEPAEQGEDASEAEDDQEGDEVVTLEDVDGMTKVQLRALLDDWGIEWAQRWSKIKLKTAARDAILAEQQAEESVA